MNHVWERHGFGGRLEYVQWVVVSALIANARAGHYHTGSVSGLTTGDLVRALLQHDGAFMGSLRDVNRQVRSEASPHRKEVRAALALLLFDDMVWNPSPTHLDVWHLSQKSRDRLYQNAARDSRLTNGEKARTLRSMKSSV